MVNAAWNPALFVKFPTAVQFLADGHVTELRIELKFSICTPLANSAGRASSHTPFVDVMVKASWEPELLLNFPTATQFLAVGHDTELRLELGSSFWTPIGNTAGRASSHTPFVDVMVNASS